MNDFRRVVYALLALMFLAGCGQSGPLFVPGDPSTVQQQPQQQPAAEDEEDDEDDEDGAARP